MKRSAFATVVSVFLAAPVILTVGCRPRSQAPPDLPAALPPPSTAQTAQMPPPVEAPATAAATETVPTAVPPAEAPAAPQTAPAAPAAPPAQPAQPAQPAAPPAAPAAPAQAPPPATGVAQGDDAPKPAAPAPQAAKPVRAAAAPQASAPKAAAPPQTAKPAPVAPKPANPEPAKPAASKPAPTKPTSAPAKPTVDAAATEVIGTIEVVSDVPDPSSVPYDTCVTFIKYKVSRVLGGSYDGGELLAVFWGMKDGKLQPAARFTVGQSHRLTVAPFSEQEDLARVMQADDTNEYSLTPYWVVSYAGR